MDRDDLLQKIRSPGSALLDGWSDAGRWTMALPEPLEEFRVEWGEEHRLDEFLSSRRFENGASGPGAEIPFLGGWVGFISYEVGSLWEGAPRRAEFPPEPAALFYRHESGYAISPEGETWRFSPGGVHPTSEADRAAGVNARAQAGLRAPEGKRTAAEGRGDFADPALGPGAARSASELLDDSLAGEAYDRAHEEIREGIARGDYYQVNLTRRYSRELGRRIDARRLYLLLAGSCPPPCSAILRSDDFDVVSASPELFLRAEAGTRRVEMRPIKGTAPRAPHPEEDRRAAEGLLGSEKDRAENVMIVDLCRHDLGRVCEPGSVTVSELCGLRSHRLHHLESRVEGTLAPGLTLAELLHATFPPGSVTGAPKRAAVGAIALLEPVPRGVYTGAVGFFDNRGRLAFNVAIRTAVSTASGVRYHSGGGITWDSRARDEEKESRWKAREFFALVDSLRGE